MDRELVFAGFGGQGVLTTGQIVSEIALAQGLNVTWMPAYGPAMRGGKAYSVVKYSDGAIGGPDMEDADVLVAMNQPSLDMVKFVKKGGIVVVNTATVSRDVKIREDLQVVWVDCTELALKAKNPKAPNIVALGAAIGKSNLFDKEVAMDAMCKYFENKGKGKYNDNNRAAFMEGYNSAK